MNQSMMVTCTFYFPGYYECQCPRYYTGVHCEVYDEKAVGGIGRPVPVTPPGEYDDQKILCIQNDCDAKANNGQCDVC